MKLKYLKLFFVLGAVMTITSCKKFFDINKDPDALTSDFILYPQLITNAQVNIGFEGGSDLFRFTTLIMQQMSGNASQPNQTYEYYRYNISGTDQNNVWGTMNANTLSDLELVIKQATADGSPHYVGVAKILKAYEYSKMVDTWGDIPYTDAQQQSLNTQPKYDDDETIYPKLITLLTEAVTDMNAASSTQSPGTNSVIYSNATWATARAQWIILANTLRLRLLLHYSKKNPTFAVTEMTNLINSTGVSFMSSNADNFQVNFYNVTNQRNPISQFEVSRATYLYSDQKMVGMMNAKADPRRPFYFTPFPYVTPFNPFSLATNAATTADSLKFANTTGVVVGAGVTGNNIPAGTTVTAVTATKVTLNNALTGSGAASGDVINFAPVYAGVPAAVPPPTANSNYSRIHTFLRGAVTAGTAPPFTYAGAAPTRILPYAEYCFIRAEAALMGAPGNPQTWFTNGITASMQEAGVSAGNITTYLAANGTLAGTNPQKLQQIIEEKYIALFGVAVEPWNDWRRTGYPSLTIPANALSSVTSVPRTLFYPQSELDYNPNNPGQKPVDLQSKVFWDN